MLFQSRVKALTAENRQLENLLDAERAKTSAMEKQISSASKAGSVRKSTRDAGVQMMVLTRDVGVTHVMPRTR